MIQYWTEKEWKALRRAKTVHDLKEIAFAVLERMPKPIVQICGPISTGGKGSAQENLKVFSRAIEVSIKKGIIVFDQMPFEDPMQKVEGSILEDFYAPIFESGHIHTLHFLPDWRSSKGAK